MQEIEHFVHKSFLKQKSCQKQTDDQCLLMRANLSESAELQIIRQSTARKSPLMKKPDF
jgi:hypothetical protein